jgi:MYXO-CTERM domain-containing protein
MIHPIVSAHSSSPDTAVAIRETLGSLQGAEPRVVVFFHSPGHDGARIREAFDERFAEAEVVGCSTSGEFTDNAHGDGGLAVLALGGALVRRCAVAVRDLGEDARGAVRSATEELGEVFETSLRDLDPSRHIGIVLVDSALGQEETVNEVLGNVAPLLSFVGGSAGDNLVFAKSWVHGRKRTSEAGVVLLLVETSRPFHIVKACNYEPTDAVYEITRAEHRVVHEIDGRPAARVYAEAIGKAPEELDFPAFLANPLGLMIDGKPWLRSPYRLGEGDTMIFACEIVEGMRMNLMRGRDIVDDTRQALEAARRELGGEISAGLLFNCAYRKVEVQVTNAGEAYHQVLSGFPLAGFHTHGESWLGHINQTLTGVLFG